MKNKGLKTNLTFYSELDEEVPELTFNIPYKSIKKKVKINIEKKVIKNGRDSSTNSKLF